MMGAITSLKPSALLRGPCPPPWLPQLAWRYPAVIKELVKVFLKDHPATANM